MAEFSIVDLTGIQNKVPTSWIEVGIVAFHSDPEGWLGRVQRHGQALIVTDDDGKPMALVIPPAEEQ